MPFPDLVMFALCVVFVRRFRVPHLFFCISTYEYDPFVNNKKGKGFVGLKEVYIGSGLRELDQSGSNIGKN